jgi:hypothetical protein
MVPENPKTMPDKILPSFDMSRCLPNTYIPVRATKTLITALAVRATNGDRKKYNAFSGDSRAKFISAKNGLPKNI